MSHIFISVEAADLSPGRELMDALRAAGMSVDSSPRNPLHGEDPRWSTWYAGGLEQALRAADVVVLVVDGGWAASTWMAREADTAFQQLPEGAVAFWNPSNVTIEAAGVARYLRYRLPDELANAVAELLEIAAARKSARMDAVVRDEWRELGFFYESDEEAKEWRLRGSRDGLLHFASVLAAYARNPANAVLGEHEHFGPYMYLKIMTWNEPVLKGDAIGGSLDDIARLAELMRARLQDAVPGQRFSVGHDFDRSAEYSMSLQVEDGGFDPASADAQLPHDQASKVS